MSGTLFLEDMTPQQALERLQAQCSRAEYCTGQIRRKLLVWSGKNKLAGKQPFSEEEMEGIVGALVGDRYVDDARFADAYVRDKARFAKWGRVKVQYNLKVLGIDPMIIRVALEENSTLFDDGMLEELLRKKWNLMRPGDTLEKKREKLLRFALGRGFEYDRIMGVIKNFS